MLDYGIVPILLFHYIICIVFNKESLHYAFYIFSFNRSYTSMVFKHAGDLKQRRAHFVL